VSYTVLARKWRPKNFSELVGQQHVMQSLANALDQQRLHHAYLFTGTRGVGKTTIARIFSKALNCEQGIRSNPCGVCSTCQSVDQGRFVDLIEVDAASKTKVDDTRELLENVQYAPVQGRFKVYLIDEVHMLSKHSFNALLKTLEEPPEHVKFLLATTDPHKLPVTVLSRCLQFNLMRLTQAQIKNHLAYILEQEKITFEAQALELIAKSADGSARDSLSILDQAIAFGAGSVEFENTKSMLGLVDQQYTIDIIEALMNVSADAVLEIIKRLSQVGVDYEALNSQLIEVLHQVSMLQVLGSLSEESSINDEVLMAAANSLPAGKIQSFYQIALLAKQDMRLAPDIRIAFEMALLRMLAFEFIETNSEESSSSIKSVATKNVTTSSIAEPEPAVDYGSITSPAGVIQSIENGAKKPQSEENNLGQIVGLETDSRSGIESTNEIDNKQEEFINKLKGKINQTLGKPEEVEKPPVDSKILNKEALQENTFELGDTEAMNSEAPSLNPLHDSEETQLNLANMSWQQIIAQLDLKGMEADLANSSILIEQVENKLVLSIDPDNIKALDLAVEKLQQIIKEKLGCELSFIMSEQEHLTPNKVMLNEKENRKQAARQNIYNDEQVQNFVQILNMEVIDSSIRPNDNNE